MMSAAVQCSTVVTNSNYPCLIELYFWEVEAGLRQFLDIQF